MTDRDELADVLMRADPLYPAVMARTLYENMADAILSRWRPAPTILDPGSPMTALDQSIVAFATAHAAELTVAEVATLLTAAGIVARVHTSPAYLPPATLVTEAELAALREGLRGG